MTTAKRTEPAAPDTEETAPPGIDGYVLEDQIGHILRRANQRATAIFMERMAPAQLTPTQWAAMVKIFECGPLSQNYLGRLAAMDAATMQGVIRRLLERDYVTRCPDPNDRRRLLLDLTPEGKEIVRASLDRARAVSRDTLSPLSPQEQATLVRLLRRLA